MSDESRLERIARNLDVPDPPYYNGPEDEAWAKVRADASWMLDEILRYRKALAFYATPDSYFAIGIFPDPPCGEFMDDFSDADEWAEYGAYNRPMPGKRAREALVAED